jgi:hydrogenase maturation protein HypF
MFTIEEAPSRLKPRIQILALGSDTHQRISWTQKGKIFSLRPKKDFKAIADFYQEAVRFLLKKFKVVPEIITYDPHPFFICGRQAHVLKEKYFSKAKLVPIFHHEAHVANFGIETGSKKKFIGIAFDGTGFGRNRHIWGGEFFICGAGFKRAAHFDEQALPGNEAAIREPWRTAFSILWRIYGKKASGAKLSFLKGIPKEKLKLVAEMLDKNFNAPLTSSVGRLFDAASALLNIKPVVQKEAEAAVELEKSALKFTSRCQAYPFRVHKKDGIFLVDVLPAFRQMAKDMGQKKSVSEIAYRFHLTIVQATLHVCGLLKRIYSINNVYCSGGVFMNRILTDELKKLMPKAGFSVYFAERPYTTDIGISQGQIAALMMEKK